MDKFKYYVKFWCGLPSLMPSVIARLMLLERANSANHSRLARIEETLYTPLDTDTPVVNGVVRRLYQGVARIAALETSQKAECAQLARIECTLYSPVVDSDSAFYAVCNRIGRLESFDADNPMFEALLKVDERVKALEAKPKPKLKAKK